MGRVSPFFKDCVKITKRNLFNLIVDRMPFWKADGWLQGVHGEQFQQQISC